MKKLIKSQLAKLGQSVKFNPLLIPNQSNFKKRVPVGFSTSDVAASFKDWCNNNNIIVMSDVFQHENDSNYYVSICM